METNVPYNTACKAWGTERDLMSDVKFSVYNSITLAKYHFKHFSFSNLAPRF